MMGPHPNDVLLAAVRKLLEDVLSLRVYDLMTAAMRLDRMLAEHDALCEQQHAADEAEYAERRDEVPW